jgi:hypothetical protein
MNDLHDGPPHKVWQPKFGLATMMLVMLVFCVMAAAGSYLLRAVDAGTSPRAVFIIFTLAAPVLVVVALSAFRQCLRWLDRPGRRP